MGSWTLFAELDPLSDSHISVNTLGVSFRGLNGVYLKWSGINKGRRSILSPVLVHSNLKEVQSENALYSQTSSRRGQLTESEWCEVLICRSVQSNSSRVQRTECQCLTISFRPESRFLSRLAFQTCMQTNTLCQWNIYRHQAFSSRSNSPNFYLIKDKLVFKNLKFNVLPKRNSNPTKSK